MKKSDIPSGDEGWTRQLDEGDEVKWTDPDDGTCSYIGTIQTIVWMGDVCRITFKDGHTLEAFEHELS